MTFRLTLASLVFLSGCGYALVGHSNFLNPSIRTIQVPAFVNRTTRVELEQRVTQSVADEFVSRGRLKLVSAPNDADVILKGTKVDGMYDADPMVHPGASRFDRISYLQVLEQGLKVMDATAISLCMDNRLPIVVFNLRTVSHSVESIVLRDVDLQRGLHGVQGPPGLLAALRRSGPPSTAKAGDPRKTGRREGDEIPDHSEGGIPEDLHPRRVAHDERG